MFNKLQGRSPKNRHYLFALLFFFGAAQADENESSWQAAKPNDFNVAEQFFARHDCRLVFPAVYFYDPHNEHWLSSEQAREQFPEATPLIKDNECASDISRSDVADTFNIELAESTAMVILFVGPPEGMIDMMYPAGSPRRVELDQQLEALDAYAELPRYWVTTPLAGMRPQQM